MLVDFGIFLGGLAALVFGADWMVKGSSSIALRLGITPLIVGCTVVAFGTSMPEMVVSLAAVLTKSDDISIGNIIGSNIANLALILGAAAVIRPIEVHSDVIKREFPVMIAASVAFCVLALDGEISRMDGAMLLGGMGAYLMMMLWLARKEMADAKSATSLTDLDVDPGESTTAMDAMKIVAGIVGLTVGAHFMVQASVSIAAELGIPQMVVGIAIVAVGTSLPELATSVVAALRNESDISVGNVIGSNIFNILCVIGVVGTIAAISVGADALSTDLWIMLGVAVLAWPIMWMRKRISRFEGAVMLVLYFAYTFWLFVR